MAAKRATSILCEACIGRARGIRLGTHSQRQIRSLHAFGRISAIQAAYVRPLSTTGRTETYRRRTAVRGFSADAFGSATLGGLFIQTEDTPNPNSLKFHPGITVLP